MSSDYSGHCLCGGIKVTLKNTPSGTMVCHCKNCRRGGGPCSIDYVVPVKETNIEDPKQNTKQYADKNTKSGNTIMRAFCGNCGSPIWAQSPAFPGKYVVRANLFDTVAAPSKEAFTESKISWIDVKIGQSD